jgi:hypothetical protein
MKTWQVEELKNSIEDWEWKLYNKNRDCEELEFKEILELRELLLSTLKYIKYTQTETTPTKCKILKFETPEDKKIRELTRHIIKTTKSF